MASTAGQFNANKLARSVTLTIRITGMRRFRFRMWCAIRLIKLAAFICPATVVVENE